jgi:general secretion pathway protein A
LPGLWAIYRISNGYPRKIINLCHQSILSMIIQNRSKSGYLLVSTCARRVFPEESTRRRFVRAAVMAAGAAAVALVIFLPSDGFKTLQNQGLERLKSVFFRQRHQEVGRPAAESTPRTFSARIAPDDFDSPRRPESEPGKPPKTSVAVLPEVPVAAKELPQDNPARQEKAPPISAEPVNGKQSLQSPAAPTPVPEPPVSESALVASVAKTPGNAGAEILAESTYSTILGQLTLKRSETLSRIIMGVYGGFNTKYFKSFIIANPDIEDPDRVNVGQIISLPAIPARVTPPSTPVWWVRIEDSDSLEAAFNILRQHPDRSAGMRLIPHWNPSDGTRFAVVLDELFTDEYSARNHLQQLPAGFAATSTVLSRWDKKTVYFANPYFNYKH